MVISKYIFLVSTLSCWKPGKMFLPQIGIEPNFQIKVPGSIPVWGLETFSKVCD